MTTAANRLSRMPIINIQLSTQTLVLRNAERELLRFSVSTAKNGAGELEGSECTPRGHHIIAAKIGGQLPLAAALTGRKATGEICDQACFQAAPTRDWILTRILWLQGQELGRNKGLNSAGQNVDSMSRYIYIHGTPDAEPMGEPRSHGCIRMRNSDIVTLYQAVEPGTEVLITE